MDWNTWVMPQYPPFFPVDDTSKWALGKHAEINEKINGKSAMTPQDAAILAQAVRNAGDGDHLEIGSLFGGSAILAALTKKLYGLSGGIVCIDDLEMTGDNVILKNAALFGVDDIITVYLVKSNPFPFQRRFVSTLIDASHDYGWCLADWKNAKQYTDKYIIFHDYDPSHMGVVDATKEAMQEWRPVFLAEHTLVLGRP